MTVLYLGKFVTDSQIKNQLVGSKLNLDSLGYQKSFSKLDCLKDNVTRSCVNLILKTLITNWRQRRSTVHTGTELLLCTRIVRPLQQ